MKRQLCWKKNSSNYRTQLQRLAIVDDEEVAQEYKKVKNDIMEMLESLEELNFKKAMRKIKGYRSWVKRVKVEQGVKDQRKKESGEVSAQKSLEPQYQARDQ
eukprot:TRINITY_DN52848_c0_g1_i1.p3 TRINITY_DN52848_c0_g1~~TRINITY_DN52848_c0_g1_i1.p3  ORF type:complete len:102 (+),score=7.42 TRINITY_DN52848_c0_g1_i1:22-327(+)